MVRCEWQRKDKEEVARCHTELEHAEKGTEFESAISDMLANVQALEERILHWTLAA